MAYKIKSKLDAKETESLKKQLGFKNIMQVPKLKSIVLSMTTKDLISNKSLLTDLQKQLSTISGQKPMVTYAKKSIANFKLRENTPIGIKVTLRNQKMDNFFIKLISIILPRTKDFKGLSKKSFDGSGNYNIGIKEQIAFPEIDFDKINKLYGVNISIVTSAKDDASAFKLFEALGFPFSKGGN